ncbi:unnamed protein product [Moneuplotes crassus]|uniref:Uncharacterized protein n=1 Tax=Euplotes crassus TaxID=5936 RepID=A0AAD1U9T0_EUPCR|nr:unnamed protein product [Moneuplotes crassus]
MILNKYIMMKYNDQNLRTNSVSRRDFIDHLRESIELKKKEMEKTQAQDFQNTQKKKEESTESNLSSEEESSCQMSLQYEKDQEDLSQFHVLDTGYKIPIGETPKFVQKQDSIHRKLLKSFERDPLAIYENTMMSDDNHQEGLNENEGEAKMETQFEPQKEDFLSSMFLKPEMKNHENFTKPHTPYILDKKGKKHLLSLYARDQSRRELIDILMKDKKVPDLNLNISPTNLRSQVLINYEKLKCNPDIDIDVNELNLLKIRETTYHRYEKEYRECLQKEHQEIRKKSILSRNPLVTFSRTLSRPRERGRK